MKPGALREGTLTTSPASEHVNKVLGKRNSAVGQTLENEKAVSERGVAGALAAPGVEQIAQCIQAARRAGQLT
jgi:hypothetical protein